MVIKNSYVPMARLRTSNGELFKDADGATYLQDHDHEALAGKEFCNTQEAIQAISDYNEKSKTPFTGELILVNVLTFS